MFGLICEKLIFVFFVFNLKFCGGHGGDAEEKICGGVP